MTHHNIDRLAAMRLCELFRQRAFWRRHHDVVMVGLVEQAIERRYELFRLGVIS